MSVSPWAASRRSSPSTTWTARSGISRRWARQNGPLAERLLDRLRDRFAPGGLLHYGQGKWYPGEPLPRWALACYWRADGMPLWQNRALLAREGTDYGFGRLDAQRFTETLARRLGVDPEYVNPAFEDPLYYLQRERQLPINVDPKDNRLEDAQERERVRQVFERGLNTPSAMVLPLQRGPGRKGPEWQTGLWMLRGQHLFLVPGDSPVGLRLPLGACHGSRQKKLRSICRSIRWPSRVRCRFRRAAGRPKLRVCRSATAPNATASLRLANPLPGSCRTALCVEPRNGRLHVFMPPLTATEDYLDLLAAIEDTAAHLNMPVVIEGYPPPHDPRIHHIKVTPDPGVIEVNVPPGRLARAGGPDHLAYTKMPGCAGWAPKSSCSTAATPAPAAAIISCWAGRRLPTVRSCGVPICCAA